MNLELNVVVIYLKFYITHLETNTFFIYTGNIGNSRDNYHIAQVIDHLSLY